MEGKCGFPAIDVHGQLDGEERERLPQHLAIPNLWQRKALASKRVLLSFVIGYALVAFFLAYQVAFYLIAEKFGAWSPAEVPYDEMLNSAFPWIAVLFAGFFPALSEEFLSRAFSIPFFEKIFRSRLLAIVLAGFMWGFGHATYANQPFFIRGLEVGLAGVLLVFSYLIVPAVCAVTLARRTSVRLLLGWAISLVGGIAGLFVSYWGDFPSGAAIVCTFGALLILAALVALLRPRKAAAL